MPTDHLVPQPDERRRVKCTTLPEAPGALHGQVWLTVQTRQAQQLIHGREGTPEKPPIIGLTGFANRLRVIWEAAREDDPYADWWLIQVHEAIEATATVLRHRQAVLNDLLEAMTAMEVTVAASQHPVRIHLVFANPYAYRGAQLVAAYDRLVCTALTARHIGLLQGQACVQLQRACARKLRALFLIPQRYRRLKIDRETVRTAMGRSAEARQTMGELPADILSGEYQAPLVPRRVPLPTGMAGRADLRPASHGPRSDGKNDDNAGRGFPLV